MLDDLLRQDPYSRVACEVATTTGLVLVMGEITTEGYVDIAPLVRRECPRDRLYRCRALALIIRPAA